MKILSKSNLLQFVMIAFCILALGLTLRGNYGNPDETQLNQNVWKDDGPFELSPERGRFALIYSIIENRSFEYSKDIARFTTPDLGYKDGKFVSLFPPGMSLLAASGYVVGKMLGASQLGTYAVVSFFALMNLLLIKNISEKLGASRPAAMFSAFAFLFASPAFAYSVSLYQHHISTYLILASIYLLLISKKTVAMMAVWFMIALSVVVDYPNAFMMAPVAVFALTRIISFKRMKESLSLVVRPLKMAALLAVIFPIAAILIFNKYSYNNPFQLSGTVIRVTDVDAQGNPVIPENELLPAGGGDPSSAIDNRIAFGFFETRNMLNGLLVHTVGSERGILYYTPIIVFGLFGFKHLFKKNKNIATVLLTIVGINFLLYSMWGDPWGGWAFGSRYLIPSYALLAISLSKFLDKAGKPTVVLMSLILIFSIAINLLGALTTNRIPPRQEAVYLETLSNRYEPYTYERNWQMLTINGVSKSFVYNFFFVDSLSALQYYLLVFTVLLIPVSTLTAFLVLGNNNNLISLKTQASKTKVKVRSKKTNTEVVKEVSKNSGIKTDVAIKGGKTNG